MQEAAIRVGETVGSDVPVVIVSNRSDVDARLDAVRAGCSGYFVKPVDFLGDRDNPRPDHPQRAGGLQNPDSR